MDEASLASGIYQNFRKCLELRQKYIRFSLQNPLDNPKDEISDPEVHHFPNNVLFSLELGSSGVGTGARSRITYCSSSRS